jgi:enoyl-CoA hydratase/carnithine racemase
MEIKWGLVPDMAGMVTMRGLVRPDILRELVLTGRIVSGEEAIGLGLATRLAADPLAEALKLAREIAAKSPDGVRAAKRLLNLAQAGDAAEVLMAESVEQERLIGSPNQMEAVRPNLEKRQPLFRDPQDA